MYDEKASLPACADSLIPLRYRSNTPTGSFPDTVQPTLRRVAGGTKVSVDLRGCRALLQPERSAVLPRTSPG